MVIHKVSNIYTGSYGSVTQSGNKIDDNDNAFSFKIIKNKTIKTKITAGITGNIGMVQLKYGSAIHPDVLEKQALQGGKERFERSSKSLNVDSAKKRPRK